MTIERRKIGLSSRQPGERIRPLANNNFAAALLLAGAGLFIHPCDEDKRPLTRWRESSTRDQETIKEWWRRWPNALPAIDCGKSGVLVIDADRHGGPDGVEAFQSILRNNTPVEAPIVETAGRGRHFYFLNPTEIKCSTGRLARAVDVRGDGGYVIAPGATLSNGCGWRAREGLQEFADAFREKRLPRPPKWLISLLNGPASTDIEEKGRIVPARRNAPSASAEMNRLFRGNVDVLRGAVDAIPHDERIDMNTWIAIIGAICDETSGSDEGREIAHEFSARWIKEHYDEDETDGVWRRAVSNLEKSALKASGKTIRLRASNEGWAPPTGWTWPDGWNRDIEFPDERPNASNDEWPDPKPLPNGLSPVAPFDCAFLPKGIAPWVSDIAVRMQCPSDFVGISAMVGLGSVIGRKLGVRPQRKTDWLEVPNLWGCIIGRPAR